MNLSQFSTKDWRRVAVAGALLGGGATGGLTLLLNSTYGTLAFLAGAALGSSLFGLLIVLLGSTNQKLNLLRERVAQSEKEVRAMANIRPLLDDFPVKIGGWATDACFAEVLIRLFVEQRPKLILECGSGSSTILMASCLKKRESTGKIISLDHESKYAEITRKLLREHQVDQKAEVLIAPLKTWSLRNKDLTWYGLDLDALPKKDIDMLIVDGPPASNGPMARYPAVPILKDRLSDDCVILIDDGKRSSESEMARRWAEELGGSLQYEDSPKGTWIIHRSISSTHG